jgi:hypothetical protein
MLHAPLGRSVREQRDALRNDAHVLHLDDDLLGPARQQEVDA